MDQKIAKMLNEQINKELYSAYLYLQIANYFNENDLDGFGNWYTIQTQEERDHALLMLQYLHNNGEKVELGAIAQPDAVINEPMDALKAAAKHERFITASINDIYAVAYEEKDFRTMQFLDWFVKEQGEEEMNADTLVNKFQLFGGDARGLYLLNQELGGRVYSAPSLVL